MFKSAAVALIGSAAAFAPAQTGRVSTSVNAFTIDNMPGALAPMGFFDPLNFAEKADENTLKRYREAEVTHGRVGEYERSCKASEDRVYHLTCRLLDKSSYACRHRLPRRRGR